MRKIVANEWFGPLVGLAVMWVVIGIADPRVLFYMFLALLAPAVILLLLFALAGLVPKGWSK